MPSQSSNRSLISVAFISFVSAVACTSVYRIMNAKKKKKMARRDAGAVEENNDLSFYYGDKSTYLTPTICQKRKFLPSKFYADMVHNCIVCCTDIILVRTNPVASTTSKKECLLVERASEPVKGTWWWPGGRMFKGETFFDTALRKIKDEVGIDLSSNDGSDKGKEKVLLQVMGVYNTFFPTSAWDEGDEKGTQTVNAIVLIVLPENDKYDVLLDKTSERFKWISLDVDEAEKNKEDKYVIEGLRRLEAWNGTYGKLWS